jgi:CHASE2 domain-containing sensor protein
LAWEAAELRFTSDREWLWGALAVALVALVWSLDLGGAATQARERAFQILGQTFPRAPSGAVVVVDVDRASLARVAPWPWRRSLFADLIEGVAAHQPRAIGLDILLSGPDRRGPAALAKTLAEASGRTDLPGDFVDDDKTLAQAIMRGRQCRARAHP